MSFYAQRPGRFTAQVLVDAGVLLWVVAWALVGVLVRHSVALLAGPARQTAETASRLSSDFGTAATQASDVPGLGGQLRRPFDAATGSLGDLVTAADRQADSIDRFATLAGWLVFAVPVLLMIAYWLPRRIAFYRRARAAQTFLDSAADLDLFALRAMASEPLPVLARISPDPVGAWRAGDRRVIGRLAELELTRSGLRLPAALRQDLDAASAVPGASASRAAGTPAGRHDSAGPDSAG